MSEDLFIIEIKLDGHWVPAHNAGHPLEFLTLGAAEKAMHTLYPHIMAMQAHGMPMAVRISQMELQEAPK